MLHIVIPRKILPKLRSTDWPTVRPLVIAKYTDEVMRGVKRSGQARPGFYAGLCATRTASGIRRTPDPQSYRVDTLWGCYIHRRCALRP